MHYGVFCPCNLMQQIESFVSISRIIKYIQANHVIDESLKTCCDHIHLLSTLLFIEKTT